MTTSVDVARLANVSRSTVSRVLSGSAQVSPEKAARVWEVVKSTGYEPDAVAQSLVRQQSHTIALALFNNPDGFSFSNMARSRHYFYLDILAHIEHEAAVVNYDLILPSCPSSDFEHYIRSLKTRRIAGVIMIAPNPAEERVSAMIRSALPTVFIDVQGQGEHATSVKGDNVSGSKKAAEHLLQLGHRRLAILTGEMASLSATERLLGIQQALAEAGIVLDAQLIRHTDYSREEGYRATLSLLDERRDFTAIIAASDIIALGAMRALRERSARVPEEISIIGFDDLDLCLDADPPLSSIRPDKEVMGSSAVQLLLRLIKGETDLPPVIVPTSVVARQSTGSAPVITSSRENVSIIL